MKNRIKLVLIVSTVLLALIILIVRGRGSSTTSATIDSNGNGVWDNVDEEIQRRSGGNKNLVKAFEQMARALQASVSEPNMTQERAIQISIEVTRGSECVFRIDPNFDQIGLFMEGLVVNTSERTKNYIHYNALLSGQTQDSGPDEKSCDFEIEK